MQKKKLTFLWLVLPAIFCTMLWGIGVPLQKMSYSAFGVVASDTFGVLLLGGLRGFTAGICVLIYLACKKKPLVPKGAMRDCALLGMVQTFAQSFFFSIGIVHCSGMRSSVIIALQSFLAVVLSHFIFKDRITRSRVIGCLCGLAGVLILVSAAESWDSSRLGEVLVFMAALAAAGGAVVTKLVCVGDRDIACMSAWQFLLGGLALATVGCIGGINLTVNVQGILIAIALALTTSVAFTIWMLLLQHFPVGKVVVYIFLVPVFGSLFSAALLGENILSIRNILSLLSICVGIFIVNRTPNSQK